MEFGVGLWGMQSTRNAPWSHQTLYRRLAEDAQVAEAARKAAAVPLTTQLHRVEITTACKNKFVGASGTLLP